MSQIKITCVLGLAPLLLAAQAPSTHQPVANPKTDASGPAHASEVVCKKMPPPIGTRIGARQICRTQAEWDYIQTQEQEAIDRALRKPFDAR